VIARLAGMVVEKRGDAVILDVQGVGYLVHVSLQSLGKIPPEGGRAQLRCYTHVREDALQLFGFASAEEEQLFHLLISVSGVGPKLGVNILSGMPATELAQAILHGELARLTKIPGVGDIPILGNLFKSKSFQKNETELMFIVTAQLVQPVNRDDVPRLPNVESLRNGSLLGVEPKSGDLKGPSGFMINSSGPSGSATPATQPVVTPKVDGPTTAPATNGTVNKPAVPDGAEAAPAPPAEKKPNQ